MKSWLPNINGIFSALALALILSLCGCRSAQDRKDAKEFTLIRFHVEAIPNSRDAISVPIYRQNPRNILVSKDPFLDNGSILEATVAEIEGGFGIRIQFDSHGSLVLENITAQNVGRRVAIHAAFPELRWLAAPRINRRIGDGSFIFTPDATREETERIVKGLNLVAERVAKGRWP